MQISESTNLDPAAFVHTGDLTVIAETYERLLSQVLVDGRATGEFEGELAEAWKVSEDGRALTFTLREGHCFDDGSAVTAQAVKWSFERSRRVNRTAAHYLMWIDRIEVIDERTIRFHAKEPFGAALATLAYTSSAVVNPAVADNFAAADALNQWLSEHSAGSGPYRVRSWDRGNRLVLEPNTCYPEASRPYFRKVVIKAIPDPSSRRIQLRKGDVDLSLGIASTNAHYYEDLKDVELFAHPTQNQPGYWVVNTRHPVLRDPRVRHAIAHGIDYKGLIDGVLDGKAQRVTSLLPPGVPGYVPGLLDFDFDPDRSRQLLAQAGFPDGIELNLLIGLLGPVSETMQSFMAGIGIRLNLEIATSAAFFDRLRAGDFDLAYNGNYVDFLDPWAILRPQYHSEAIGNGTNMAHYSNANVDRFLDLGDGALSGEMRNRAYADAQQIIAADLPYIYLFSGSVIFATRTDISGVQIDPQLYYRLNLSQMYRNSRAGQ